MADSILESKTSTSQFNALSINAPKNIRRNYALISRQRPRAKRSTKKKRSLKTKIRHKLVTTDFQGIGMGDEKE